MFGLFKTKNYRPYNSNINYLDKKLYYMLETVEYHDDHIDIYTPKYFNVRANLKRTISYDDIKSIDYVEEVKSKEVNKSLVGRSIIGGALLGGTGAVIGAISSVKPKYKDKTYYFLVLELESGEVLKYHDTFQDSIDFKFFENLLNSYNNYRNKNKLDS